MKTIRTSCLSFCSISLQNMPILITQFMCGPLAKLCMSGNLYRWLTLWQDFFYKCRLRGGIAFVGRENVKKKKNIRKKLTVWPPLKAY